MPTGRRHAELTGGRRDADIAEVPLDNGRRVRYSARAGWHPRLLAHGTPD